MLKERVRRKWVGLYRRIQVQLKWPVHVIRSAEPFSTNIPTYVSLPRDSHESWLLSPYHVNNTPYWLFVVSIDLPETLLFINDYSEITFCVIWSVKVNGITLFDAHTSNYSRSLQFSLFPFIKCTLNCLYTI